MRGCERNTNSKKKKKKTLKSNTSEIAGEMASSGFLEQLFSRCHYVSIPEAFQIWDFMTLLKETC